ncbi:hypothetical protein [Nitratifractor sp.]
MRNAQLERLNRSILDHLSPERPCLVTEKLSMSRKRLAEMEEGDWIDLGERPVELFVRRGEERLYRGEWLPSEQEERVRIEEAVPDLVGERPGKKRVVLEGRLAVLPPERLFAGAILSFPWKLSEHIHLYVEGRYLAEARLICHEGGYALEILERCDEA